MRLNWFRGGGEQKDVTESTGRKGGGRRGEPVRRPDGQNREKQRSPAFSRKQRKAPNKATAVQPDTGRILNDQRTTPDGIGGGRREGRSEKKG